MSEQSHANVNEAFDPELRQAQNDWENYLKGRDYKDEDGEVRDALTGEVKDTDGPAGSGSGLYSQRLVDSETRNEGSREGWSVLKLAYAAKEARERGDITGQSDIEDDIQEALLARVDDESNKFSSADADYMLEKVTKIIHGNESSPAKTDVAPAEVASAEKSREELLDQVAQLLSLLKQLKDVPSDPDARAKIEEIEQKARGLSDTIESPAAPVREPIFSQEEIDETRGEADEVDSVEGEPAVPGTELELYRSAEDRKADVLKRCNNFLRSEEDPERVEMMKGLDESRSDYLAVLAKAQKGHSLRRLKPDGKTNQVLLRLFGEKFSSKTNRPTREESDARARYEEAYDKMDAQMKTFLHGQREIGNINETELREIYLETLSAQHLANVREIAQIQKESSKKPMNKWLRRAGYVGAGIGAGLLTTLGPLGWVAGAGLALGGAGGLRVAANKRNANTIHKETDSLYVDEKASLSAETFQTGMSHNKDGETSIRDVTTAHDSEVSREVVGNRDRLLRPIVAAIGAAAVARIGYEAYAAFQPAEMTAQPDTPSSSDETRTPVEVDDMKPENTPSDTDTYKPPTDLDTDSPETLATPTEAYVESGSGEIRETKQILEQVLGTDVSMEDAERVYNTVTQNQGDIFVNDPNYTGPDSDVRIGAPGTYTFKDGIVNKMVEQYNILKS